MELSYSETNAAAYEGMQIHKINSQGQKNHDQFDRKCAANTQNTAIIVCFALCFCICWCSEYDVLQEKLDSS